MSKPGGRGAATRVREAIERRLRGPYAALGRVEEQNTTLDGRLLRIETTLQRIEATLRNEVRAALAAVAAEEAEGRRRLGAARSEDDFEAAWTESEPLISVTVATLGRPELLSRSLPSILAQSYPELEVIVVGDGAGAQIGRQVEAIGDQRVRYLNLERRQPLSDHPGKLWLTGATRARNAAVERARGRWVVEFDDDDAMLPGCLESLLGLARESGAEAVYGRFRLHEGGVETEIGEFPPRLGYFSWAAGMYHAGLRFFGREHVAADLGIPGDWWLTERMLRVGVSFAMLDDVLCEVYGSARKADALEAGFPWLHEPQG
jgi:hypothetical protein